MNKETGSALLEFHKPNETGIPGNIIRKIASFDFFDNNARRDNEKEWLFRTIILFMVMTAVRSFNVIWMCVLGQKLQELTKRLADLSFPLGVLFSLHNDKPTQEKFKCEVLIIPHEAVNLCALWSLAVLMYLREMNGNHTKLDFGTMGEASKFKVSNDGGC